jgi:hypothetical protein
MKVPTYQAQSQQTPKTGAGTFSVAASPTNISRGLAAQGDLFAQLQGTSLKFLETETRVQRATELSQAENAFDFQMQSVTMKALEDTNPNSMLSNWNTSTTDLYNNIALNINDPVVKRQFIAKAQNSILAKRLSVLKTARARRIENAKAEKDIEIYRLKKTIATGNATEREAAKVALFGREKGIDNFTGDTLPRVPSIYERMANAGLISATEKVTAELDAKGDIQNMEISQDMTAARVSGNPLHAQAIIDNLQDPSNYPDLFGEERDQLIKDAIALRDAQTTDLVAQEKAKIALDNAKATKKKEETFDDFILRIDQSKLQANRAEGITPPTLSEIEKSYQDGNLKYERYKILKDKIETGDLESSNSVMVQEFVNKIDLAGSDAELEGIRGEIDAAAEMLDSGTMTTLKTRIKERKGNTPRSIEIVKAKTDLRAVLGVSGGIDNEERAILRLAAMDALNTYDDLVAKGGDPRAIANYLAQGYYSNLTFADDFPNLALAPSIMERAMDMMGNKNTLSPGEVNQLNQMITVDERLTPNMKAEERRTLKLYVEHLNRLDLLDRMRE